MARRETASEGIGRRQRFTKNSIADGFADDCDELIRRCVKPKEALNYHVFCNIWKDMKFAQVFSGRSSGIELLELSEELIHIATKYMVKNTTNFEESVAGLFLVYGVVRLQPCAGFASLRLVPADLPAVARLEGEARRQKRQDVLYILGRLLIHGPVQFHASPREHGLDAKTLKGFTVSEAVGPKGVFRRGSEELDVMQQLSGLSRHYTQTKASITGDSKPSRELNYVDEHIASELADSLNKLISGDYHDAVPGPATHHEKVQSIKERTMFEIVKKIKHLTSVDDRQGELSGSGASRKPSRSRASCMFEPSDDSDDDITPEEGRADQDLGTIYEVLDKRLQKGESAREMVEIDGEPTPVEERKIVSQAESQTSSSVASGDSNSKSSAQVPDQDQMEVKPKRGGKRPRAKKKWL